MRAVVLTPWPEQPSAVECSNRETLAREVPVATLAAGAGAEALPVAEWLDEAPDPPLRTGARR